MPPDIYKSSRYPTNLIKRRLTATSASFWLEFYFPSFETNLIAGHSEFNISMPSFSFVGEAESNSFNAIFPISEIDFTVISGGVSALNVQFPSFLSSFLSNDISLDASVINISASGICYQVPSIKASLSAIEITSSGEINGSVTIISPDSETGSDNGCAYNFDGDLYLVLNLKTKAHSTYRDGNNNAIAQTGELTFSSQYDKNVSDAYILSKSTGDVRFVSKSGENTERVRDLTFKIDDAGTLRNKKVLLAKGLKSQTWQFSVLSPDSEHLEVRAIDLIVNKTKRRV